MSEITEGKCQDASEVRPAKMDSTTGRSSHATTL